MGGDMDGMILLGSSIIVNMNILRMDAFVGASYPVASYVGASYPVASYVGASYADASYAGAYMGASYAGACNDTKIQTAA